MIRERELKVLWPTLEDRCLCLELWAVLGIGSWPLQLPYETDADSLSLATASGSWFCCLASPRTLSQNSKRNEVRIELQMKINNIIISKNDSMFAIKLSMYFQKGNCYRNSEDCKLVLILPHAQVSMEESHQFPMLLQDTLLWNNSIKELYDFNHSLLPVPHSNALWCTH